MSKQPKRVILQILEAQLNDDGTIAGATERVYQMPLEKWRMIKSGMKAFGTRVDADKKEPKA